MYNIILSEYASEQLVEIKRHLSNSSLDIASRIADEIAQFAVERLSSFPLSGPKVFENLNYRNIFKHSYRIIYRVAEKEVYVISIVHSHQDIEKIMGELQVLQK